MASSLPDLLLFASVAAREGRRISTSYLIHLLDAYERRMQAGSLLSSLPDDVVLHILSFLIPSSLPTEVLRAKPLVLALCGRRGVDFLDSILPDPCGKLRRLREYREMTSRSAHVAALTWTASVPFDTDRAFRMWWSDGTSDFVWFRDRLSRLDRDCIDAHVSSHVTERDVYHLRRVPIAVSVHSTVLRSRWNESPFARTREYSILLRNGEAPRVVRWIDEQPDAMVPIVLHDA